MRIKKEKDRVEKENSHKSFLDKKTAKESVSPNLSPKILSADSDSEAEKSDPEIKSPTKEEHSESDHEPVTKKKKDKPAPEIEDAEDKPEKTSLKSRKSGSKKTREESDSGKGTFFIYN